MKHKLVACWKTMVAMFRAGDQSWNGRTGRKRGGRRRTRWLSTLRRGESARGDDDSETDSEDVNGDNALDKIRKCRKNTDGVIHLLSFLYGRYGWAQENVRQGKAKPSVRDLEKACRAELVSYYDELTEKKHATTLLPIMTDKSFYEN